MNKHYDLIVVGGGFAGVAAAMEASRHGRKVLLVDKYNCLGGTAVGGLVLPFMPYSTREEGNDRPLTGDLFLEIVEGLAELGGLGANRKCFDEEILKLVLQRMCLKYGVELLFNTTVTDVTVENGVIKSLSAWGKSRRMTLTADAFIDATGDAELSVLAGASYQLGREEDNLCQPMTLSFRVGGVDLPKAREHRQLLNETYLKWQAEGKVTNPRENVLLFATCHDTVYHFNTTRVVKHDPTDPVEVTKAELIAREQVFEIMEILKEIPGYEKAFLQSTALQIGIRESRMVEGLYKLTVEDLKGLARFDDAIAVANYDIDIHNPEGSGTSHYYFKPGDWYEIPYRCLVPKGFTNLLVAGRCISSTHEAQASYRIMPYCAELGQAAGAAVAVAQQNGTDLPGVDIKKVQTILRAEKYMI